MMRLFVRLVMMLLMPCVGGFAFAAADTTQPRKSGYEFMQPATQALQKDDSQNPAMLWVKDGEAHWASPQGVVKKSCADCHGNAVKSMRGVAARYPAFSTALKRPVNLQQQINLCRTKEQQVPALPAEDQTLLGIEAYLALQSRRMPIAPPIDTKLNAARTRGEALFNQRIGQIDLSCKDCHVDQAGKSLAGNVIPQAHPTGYPIYRLEWQGVGSLQRRLRNCMVGVRAEPYAPGSEEMLALEVYLASRAKGMLVDSPAVRP